jgi:hypothetical protein
MKLSSTFLLGTTLSSMAWNTANANCPGSPAGIHARCEMEITFPHTDCDRVQEEMARRIAGDLGWTDPHNGGHYELDSTSSIDGDVVFKGSHLSGNGGYTDLFEMTFGTNKEGDSCVVTACSESQVTSVIDYSTNYCNLRNLYCSADQPDGCPIVGSSFEYVETYKKCRQRDAKLCVPDMEDEARA